MLCCGFWTDWFWRLEIFAADFVGSSLPTTGLDAGTDLYTSLVQCCWQSRDDTATERRKVHIVCADDAKCSHQRRASVWCDTTPTAQQHSGDTDNYQQHFHHNGFDLGSFQTNYLNCTRKHGNTQRFTTHFSIQTLIVKFESPDASGCVGDGWIGKESWSHLEYDHQLWLGSKGRLTSQSGLLAVVRHITIIGMGRGGARGCIQVDRWASLVTHWLTDALASLAVLANIPHHCHRVGWGGEGWEVCASTIMKKQSV